MSDVAALYIDPRGPYPAMPGVDCWGEERDARKWWGPGPCVAHPPCGPWGNLRRNWKGGEVAKLCGLDAVGQVQAFGGVLEQPAGSKLWEAAALPYPGDGPPDRFGGFSIEVNQSDWGHKCRKPTWLYVVVKRTRYASMVPAGICFLEALLRKENHERKQRGAKPTHWIGGSRANPLGPVPRGIKVASAEIRRRTPVEFAEWLVSIARRCAP